MTAMVIREPIQLLNASYEPLSANYSVQKAARLLALGKAVIEEAAEDGRMLGQWAYPKIIRLTYMVKVAYNKIYGPPRPSKRGVILRDQGICAYCPSTDANTVDHIHPKSRGGKSDWMNLVASCKKCNNKKDDRTPEEARMVLLRAPYVPKRRVAGSR